jgi:pyrroloquinoline quinone biosynthesis protein B
MQIRVLGSAAGGGVPQWNCGCTICRGARDGSLRVRPRTQASAAVSADGRTWFLLHASPDVRTHIESCPPLHPRTIRHTPISGVLLANGDLDACLGLLSLREAQRFAVYTTGAIARGFTDGNVLVRTLERFAGQVQWRKLALGEEQPLLVEGRDSGLAVTAIAVPGKVPLHLAAMRAPVLEDNVALRIREASTGRTLVWAPSVARPTRELVVVLRESDCVLFDGTFWSSDELEHAGAGTRRAEDMGHWPVGGAHGSLQVLAGCPGRRILVHLNNTNPLLVEYSPEHQLAEQSGVEIAVDGMEVTL